MTFAINNPLGNGGYGFSQPMNLTQGVEAMQRTEIQQKLRSAEEEKRALRDDEKFLLTQMPEQIDAMRTNMATKLSKELDGFTKMQAKMIGETGGKPLSLQQKMQITNETRRINALVGDEQTFIKAYEQTAPAWRQALQKATTQEEKDFINGKINDLQKKILDPNYKPLSIDLLEPLTPPPAPAYKTYEDIDKELMPKIKQAVKSIGGGRSAIDEQMALDIIGKNLAGRGESLDQLGLSSGAFTTPEEKNKFFLDRIRGSVNVNETGWKPSSGVSGGSGGDLSKKTNLTLTPVSLGGVKKNVLNFPQQMSRVEKKYTIGDAIDPETGKTIPINKEVSLNNMSIIEDDGVIRAEIAGGEVKRKGEPLLYEESVASAMDGQPIAKKEQSGKTVSEMKKNAFALLKGKSKDATWDAVKDVDVIQNEDGTYSLKGTLTYKPSRINVFSDPKEVQVETKLTTLTDDKEKKVVYLPINQYRNMVEGMSKQYKVGDKSFTEYLDEIENGKAQSSPQENAPNEVQRTTKDGKTAIFDATTKKFIRYAN